MCVLGPRIYLFCLACICWDQCYAVGSKSKITRTRRGASSCYYKGNRQNEKPNARLAVKKTIAKKLPFYKVVST